MLGKVGMKKLFSLKILERAGVTTAPLTHNVRCRWHEKALFIKNDRRGCFDKLLQLGMLGNIPHKKPLFTENPRRGLYEKAHLTQ